MNRSLIVGFIGPDKPGLVKQLSEIVVAHNGNWLESRMSRMAGMFAGTARVELPEEKDKLTEFVAALESVKGLTVSVHSPPESAESAETILMTLNMIGPDRVGILREITEALARSVVNVTQLETRVAPAAMSGELTFCGDAIVEVPVGANRAELIDRLNEIGDDIGVDILLEEIADSE